MSYELYESVDYLEYLGYFDDFIIDVSFYKAYYLKHWGIICVSPDMIRPLKTTAY